MLNGFLCVCVYKKMSIYIGQWLHWASPDTTSRLDEKLFHKIQPFSKNWTQTYMSVSSLPILCVCLLLIFVWFILLLLVTSKEPYFFKLHPVSRVSVCSWVLTQPWTVTVQSDHWWTQQRTALCVPLYLVESFFLSAAVCLIMPFASAP